MPKQRSKRRRTASPTPVLPSAPPNLTEKVVKDLAYRIYEAAILEGREIVREALPDDLDLLDDFAAKDVDDKALWKQLTKEGNLEDFERIARDYLNGIEDGIRSALGKRLREYKAALQKEFEG